jgi:23S rRNA (adenine2030-N6)-methyltransferase
MNYRHAYHAGNFADVHKHVVLARILEHLKTKDAPFRVVDVHAGIGFYDLGAESAEKTGEWRSGVGRLYGENPAAPAPLAGEAEALIAPWRKAVSAVNDGVRLIHYPGSPEITRRLVRDQDRLVFNELHPEDFQTLERRFGREHRARLTEMDAWTALKANVPPPERRGLVLIDPPYEVADEVQRALAGLADAHRRFATGVYSLWYPIKSQADANALARRAAALNLPKSLRVELTVRRADHGDRLNGSGMILVNPPWKLESELKVLMPALAQRLADPEARFAGGTRLEWLVEEQAAGRKAGS